MANRRRRILSWVLIGLFVAGPTPMAWGRGGMGGRGGGGMRAGGGGQVLSVRKSLATAIGGALPVGGDVSHMVIDLGAGMTNVGVVAMGLATAGVSIRCGGDDLNEMIRRLGLNDPS